MTSVELAPGGYRFIPGVLQYSGGVAALPGFRIERVTFRTLVPLSEGFRRIEQIVSAAGRPLASFCACELRSPAPSPTPASKNSTKATRHIYLSGGSSLAEQIRSHAAMSPGHVTSPRAVLPRLFLHHSGH